MVYASEFGEETVQLTEEEYLFAREWNLVPESEDRLVDAYLGVQLDEESAFLTGKLRCPSNAPIFLNLKTTRREVVRMLMRTFPEQYRDFEGILRDGGLPVVRVRVPIYGLKRAQFDYERSRDERLDYHGLCNVNPAVRHYSYTDGSTYRAVMDTYTDDHTLKGHVRAVLHCLKKLIAPGPHQMNYGKNIKCISDLLGLSFAFKRIERCLIITIDQVEYGRYWVSRFEDEIGRVLKEYVTPSCQPRIGKPGDPDPPGNYQQIAPTYVMAMFYAARMTTGSLQFPCVALSRRFTQWSADEDRRLIVAYGYWKKITREEYKLHLTMDMRDLENGFDCNVYSDTDHAADPYSRRSTSGHVAIITGSVGCTNSLMDQGTKSQPKITTSSGAAESVGADDALFARKDMEHATGFDELAIAEQVEFVKELKNEYQAACTSMRRVALPCLHLLEGLGVQIRQKTLRLDASTAVSAVNKGWSKLLLHLDRSLGVNLGFVAETIDAEGIIVEKWDTETNSADLFTKYLQDSKRVIMLLRLIGVVATRHE